VRRSRRLAVIAVAWAAPFLWVTAAVFAGPSDGTTISPPTAFFGAEQWGETATVVRAYGDTPLREGDLILEIDGRTIEDWVDDPGTQERRVGDQVGYRIRRPAEGLDRIRRFEVELTSYPLGAAAADNIPTLVLALGLLVAGTYLFWARPRDATCLALLSLGVAVPSGMTAYPLGLGGIDLAGSRGVWPHVVGDLVYTVGVGSMLLIALTFPWTRAWLKAHPVAWLVPYLVPFLGYAVWAVGFARDTEPDAARLQDLIMFSGPALLVALPLILVIEAHGYVRAPTRDDRIALRLVILGTLGAVLVRVLLGEVPQQLIGRPLVPWDLQALILIPAMLVCLVAAVLRYRLREIDAVLRRSILQVVVATLVGTVFLAAAGAVNATSENSFESMLAGGVLAVILVPLALALRRTASQFVYGDRDFPYQVVSELRRLEPGTTPTDALNEMLTLLGRRLRLSYASIEVYGATPDDRIETSIGEPRGQPTAVLLEVGGTTLGQLQLEVAPGREPFGPRDRRLLEDVGGQVGAMVQALTINRELQRSREGLIGAREEERRRVRRDLHDGLGPSLATMAMKLEVARDLIPDDPDGAARLMGQLADQTRADIGEIRRLVDGLRPPALDQLGLVSALRQRADEHNAAVGRGTAATAMSWSIQADQDVEPLPAAVEVAAYRIVVEAVNNALRHSHASTCSVSLRRRDGALEVEVEDTGSGMGPDPRHGVGLGSMQERAEELGGTCTFSSVPGRGTCIRAVLPLTGRSNDESTRL
jgi:signal transduction histidine kinase